MNEFVYFCTNCQESFDHPARVSTDKTKCIACEDEQTTPKQTILNVLSKTCYCAAIPEPHDPLRCGD
jgi:hypothetical protein